MEPKKQKIYIQTLADEVRVFFPDWRDVFSWKKVGGYLAAPGLGIHCKQKGNPSHWVITHLSSGFVVTHVMGNRADAVDAARWLESRNPGRWEDGTPIMELIVLAREDVTEIPVRFGWDTGRIPGVEE